MGWAGALLILGAYFLLSFGRLSARSRIYHLMNMTGAVGFIINTWWHGALPSMVLNVVWLLIGGAALWQMAKAGSSTSAM